MRILIVNTDYKEFIQHFYTLAPELASATYAQQMTARNNSLFGASDFFSRNLAACGCEALDVHANNEFMQKRWALEHGLDFGPCPTNARAFGNTKSIPIPGLARKIAGAAARKLGLSRSQKRSLPPWMLPILRAQIGAFQPDIIINKDMYMIPAKTLAEGSDSVKCVVGQIAAPIPKVKDWSHYKLIISSIPSFVDRFRREGFDSEFLALGFDPIILEIVPEQKRTLPLLFVGSFSGAHQERIELLEHIASHHEMEIWATGLNALTHGSPIRQHVRGQAFGGDMYRLMRSAKIVLNNHIDIAGSYANNCRLFEATGSGALLLTDWKTNLSDYFEPGKEILAFSGKEECSQLISQYLKDDVKREAIAKAGQQRTLKQHCYKDRMRELLEILHRRIC